MSESARALHELVAEFARLVAHEIGAPVPVATAELSWRERLWSAPEETRLGVAELSEALGRPESWVYRHCSSKSGLELLPHRKMDGANVFLVGEIRAWIRDHEEVVVRPTTPVLSITRRAGEQRT